MIWYIFPLLFLLVFFYKHRPKNIHYVIGFILVAFVYGSGYMTGSDWRYYELLYSEATLSNLQYYEKEAGYYFIMIFFKFLKFDFFTFTIFIKTLCLGSFFYFVKSKLNNITQSLFVVFSFVALQGAFLFVNSPFRNLIAIAIFLYTFQKHFEKRPLVYGAVMLLAATIHSSAIVILVVSLLFRIFHSKIGARGLLIFYILSFLLSILPEIFKGILIELENYSTLLETKVEGYVTAVTDETASQSIFSLGSIFNLIIFIIIYKKRYLFKNNHTMVFNFAVFSLIIYRLSMIVPILSRFYLYLIIFYLIVIALIILSQFKKYTLLWITYCVVTLGAVVLGNFAYLPYSNYWVHYFNDDLKNFNYRNSYNINEWYKNHKKMPGEK